MSVRVKGEFRSHQGDLSANDRERESVSERSAYDNKVDTYVVDIGGGSMIE